MAAPLLLLAVFFSLGIWVRNFIQIPILFSFSASACLILISLLVIKKKTASILSICAVAFFIGALIFSVKQILPSSHLRNFTPLDSKHLTGFTSDWPQEIYLSGAVVNEPRTASGHYGEQRVNFLMESEYLVKEGVKQGVCGRAMVLITGVSSEAIPEYGDRVLLKGLLAAPSLPGNPAQYNYAEYLRRKDVFSVLRAKGQDAVILEKNRGGRVFRIAYKIKRKIKGLIDSNLPEDKADFLNAILLGLRGEMDFQLKDSFVKTGTVHLLAISGLHVGFLAFLAMLVFRSARIPRNFNISAVILLLIFYAILTGGSVSAVRAVIMAVTILIGVLIDREISLWNSLGLAAIIILIFDPFALFEAGFQLSFLSVFSILYLKPRLEELFGYDKKLSLPFISVWKRYLLEAFFVSFCVWIGILPVILFHYNIITPVTVIANLFAVPLSFLIVSSGAILIISSFIIPLAGKVFAAATLFLCGVLFSINDIASKIPLSHIYFPKPSHSFILLYYVFLMGMVGFRGVKIFRGKLLLAVFLILNIVIWRSVLTPADERLKVTFLDVGHGDSVFIEFPRGGNMLIDGGSEDAGRNVILPFLRNKGVYSLDAAVLTHPDSDHYGGFAAIIAELRIGRLFYSGVEAGSDSYKNLENLVAKKKISKTALRRGDLIEGINGVTLFCLNPPAAPPQEETASENDRSVSIDLRYKKINILFCGDIGEMAMSDIVEYKPDIKASLFMLPHHGERLTFAGESFIDGLCPECGVVSQGAAANEILRSARPEELLAARGIKVFRTNKGGAVFAETDGNSLTVSNFKSADKFRIDKSNFGE